jgi:hypothetical protein
MSPWVAARGASGLAQTARPLWAASRRFPPTAKASWTLYSSTETPIRCAWVPRVLRCAATARSHAELVIMDREDAGSGGCSTTFHGRLGAGVTISIDAVPGVFASGLLAQHPICYHLYTQGTGVQGNSALHPTAAATAATRDRAVAKVYERFETACDDLDCGLFDLDQRHCYCCMQFFAGAGDNHSFKKGGHVWRRACSYQVHGLGAHGGQHPEFATTARPNVVQRPLQWLLWLQLLR